MTPLVCLFFLPCLPVLRFINEGMKITRLAIAAVFALAVTTRAGASDGTVDDFVQGVSAVQHIIEIAREASSLQIPVQSAVAPEPSSAVLLGLGITALLGQRRRNVARK